MKELITKYIVIGNTGVRIRILPLGELLSLLYIIEEKTKWLNDNEFINFFECFKKTRKLKKTAFKIIKRATNIKRPKVKHLFLIELILKFNLGIDEIKNNNVKKNKADIFALIDLFASEYGWSDKYILENVSFEKAKKYSKKINDRKNKDFAQYIVSTAHAFHSPDGELIKSLTYLLKDEKRKHIKDVKSYVNELKKENT